MIVAIMQPYFLPYIGYFQLMRAVDTFVFFDDVQYVTRRWINRNRIAVAGVPRWISLPVARGGRSLAINQRHYLLEEVAPLERKLRAAYSRAPHFETVFVQCRELLGHRDSNVAAFNAHALRGLAAALGISCRFLRSSEVERPAGLRGEALVLELCRRLGATRYVNAIGGQELYDGERFARSGVRLAFLRSRVEPEPLTTGPEHLSIVDGLMRRGAEGCRRLLPDFELIEAGEGGA